MDDDRRALTPASHEDLVHSLSFALRYNRSGKRVSERDIMTANAAAEHLAEALKRSGYVVMKRPPLPAHSAPPPPHAHLYDPERFKKPDPQDWTADDGTFSRVLLRAACTLSGITRSGDVSPCAMISGIAFPTANTSRRSARRGCR